MAWGVWRMADVLGVPMAYLLARDDHMDDVILALEKLSPHERTNAALW